MQTEKHALAFAASAAAAPSAAASGSELRDGNGTFSPMVRRKIHVKTSSSSPLASQSRSATVQTHHATPATKTASLTAAPCALEEKKRKETIDHKAVIAHHQRAKEEGWDKFLDQVRKGHIGYEFAFSLHSQYLNGHDQNGQACYFKLFFPRVSETSRQMDWSRLVRVEQVAKKGLGLVAAQTLPRGTMFPYFGARYPKSSEREGTYVIDGCGSLLDGNPKLDLYGNFVTSRINEPAAGQIANCVVADFVLAFNGVESMFLALIVATKVSKGEELTWHYGSQYQRVYSEGKPVSPDRVICDLRLGQCNKRPTLSNHQNRVLDQVSEWYRAVFAFGARGN